MLKIIKLLSFTSLSLIALLLVACGGDSSTLMTTSGTLQPPVTATMDEPPVVEPSKFPVINQGLIRIVNLAYGTSN